MKTHHKSEFTKKIKIAVDRFYKESLRESVKRGLARRKLLATKKK